jgi:hypothetical protein
MVAGCRELVHRKEQLIAEARFEPAAMDVVFQTAADSKIESQFEQLLSA